MLGVALGIINATVLWLFELVGVDGTNWLWNDALETGQRRWLVIPVAALGGVLVSATFKYFGEKRLVSPNTELLDEVVSHRVDNRDVLSVLAIGAVCLLAGASLGPEASLMAFSGAIGVVLANQSKFSKEYRQMLILASVGALLVAFLDSLLMTLVPILMVIQPQLQKANGGLVKKLKSIKLSHTALLLFITSALSAWLTIRLIENKWDVRSPAVEIPHFGQNLMVAFVVGALATLIAMLMNLTINKSWAVVAKPLSNKLSWYWLGALSGAVLGLLYLLGGQDVEFSGSVGTQLLTSQQSTIGAGILTVMIITKLLATAWSKASGYRGGLVFPSIFIGVALGLLVEQAFDSFGGAGAIIGGISGMLTAVTGSPILAAVFLLAIMPWSMFPIAIAAIAGTIICQRTVRLMIRSSSDSQNRSQT